MKEIKKTVEKLGEGIVSSIKENMAAYNQVDSNLSKSLRIEANEESLKIYAFDYWDFAQKGRPGGGIPRNFESILEDWIDRHNVSFDGEKSVFARKVAWNIYHHGTRLWRNGEVRDFIKDAVEKNLEIFEKDISETLIKDITETTKE